MLRHSRLWLLSTTILVVTLLTLGSIQEGYAGAEPPPGTEVIANLRLRGELTFMFQPDPLDPSLGKAAFAFVGKCENVNPYILGPVILDFFPSDFFDPENLEEAFISTDLIGVPPGCFSESDVIVGYLVDEVKKFIVQTPTLVIAEVVILGVRPVP